MSVTIRPIEAGDKDAWYPLWQGYLAFYKAEGEISDEQSNHLFNILIGETDEIMGFAALDDAGNMVGFTHYIYHQTTWFKEGYCYLEDLYVDTNIRGGGIGEKLIDAVREKAKSDGKAELYWMTQNENFRARGLYNMIAGSSEFVKYSMEL